MLPHATIRLQAVKVFRCFVGFLGGPAGRHKIFTIFILLTIYKERNLINGSTSYISKYLPIDNRLARRLKQTV